MRRKKKTEENTMFTFSSVQFSSTTWHLMVFMILNKCVLCKADVWLYNTEHHYEDMHPEAEKPELDPEEVKFMSKKK